MNAAQNLQVLVSAKTVEALDIVTLELVAVDGKPLPAFSAGSHVDVLLPDAQGGAGITRQYSLCNDPSEAHRYQIAVLRDLATRGGSQAVHDRVNVGDVLQISAPKNHFSLAHDARKHLLLAGGIGVTPILCMAERLAQTGSSFEMHYATRAPERTAFQARIAASSFAGRVQFHYDNGEATQKLDLQVLLAKPEQGIHLYVCGPKGFMDAVLGSARAQGWPESQLHYEFFGAVVASSDSDAGFEVKLASSGRIIQIAKGKTVTKALAEAGVEIMMSCEQGVCGTCLTRVLEGTPDHKDQYLTPDERAANDQFLPCCSRSRTPMLVLDL